MSDVFLPSVLTRTLHIPFTQITRDNRAQLLLATLRKELEGRCDTEGFIKPGSIRRLVDSSVGQMDKAANVRYTASFEADVALPIVGQKLACTVTENNHAGLACNIPPHNPFLVQVFRDQHHTATTLSKYPVGSTVNVTVETLTFDVHDPFVRVKAVLHDAASEPAAELEGPTWTTETMDLVGVADIKAAPKKTFVLDGSKMTKDMRLPNVVELNTRDFSPETFAPIIDQLIQQLQNTKSKTIVFPKDFGASVRPKHPDAYRYLVDRLRLVGFRAAPIEDDGSASEASASDEDY
jgi:hypothetical protein